MSEWETSAAGACLSPWLCPAAVLEKMGKWSSYQQALPGSCIYQVQPICSQTLDTAGGTACESAAEWNGQRSWKRHSSLTTCPRCWPSSCSGRALLFRLLTSLAAWGVYSKPATKFPYVRNGRAAGGGSSAVDVIRCLVWMVCVQPISQVSAGTVHMAPPSSPHWPCQGKEPCGERLHRSDLPQGRGTPSLPPCHSPDHFTSAPPGTQLKAERSQTTAAQAKTKQRVEEVRTPFPEGALWEG